MENYLLKIKKALLEEKAIKQTIIRNQTTRCDYISTIIKELEDNFDKLMGREITLQDYLNYIESIDNNIVFDKSTEKLKYTIKSIMYKEDKAYAVKQFYNELALLTNYLKKIYQSKKTQILLKEQELEKESEHIENIDDEGNFIHPINENVIDELRKIPCLMQIFNYNTTAQIYLEISQKNTTAIKKQLKRIAQRKQQEQKDTNITIYENAKNIIANTLENIGSLTDTENEYLEELKKITNIDEIQTAIELMPSKESSLRLIIYGLKNAIETKQNTKVIEQYIKLYNQYKITEKIENKELDTLYEKYIELKENDDDLFDDLTEQQKLQLKSFETIDTLDEKIIQDIDNTLQQYELNVEYLLLYNKHNKIKNKIEDFEELEEILDDNEKIKELKSIISEYEKYEEIKEKYIERTKLDQQLEDEEDDNNILLFLTDENDQTYAQKHIESEKQFGEAEANSIKQLLKELKTNNSTYIHTIAKKVKPDDSDYKRKRLAQGKTRLIFIQVSNIPLDTEKPVYLVITAGIKTDTLQAPVYIEANHLKSKVLEYIDKYTNNIANLTPEEKEHFIKYNKKLEQNLIESMTTMEKSGGKSNER